MIRRKKVLYQDTEGKKVQNPDAKGKTFQNQEEKKRENLVSSYVQYYNTFCYIRNTQILILARI
eukprot:snap_masked-scaffold_8-processed-gene-1.27-mRNA-1 protein AED:1.00 eAED:1.00 QI:0/-1/0/0/-1/1/1/0/63